MVLLHQEQFGLVYLFSSLVTWNIMQTLAKRSIPARLVAAHITPLYPARYFTRWARRLQEHGFRREDARLLSLGKFGTNEKGAVLGVQAIVTFDRPLVNNYR
ncbi:MAG: hypothetical protein ACUVV0_09540 [Anaerolineae bacterium]